MEELKNESDKHEKKLGPYDRQKKAIVTKLKSSIKFSLIFTISIHIAMIVIGAMNLKKCPIEKNIPIYLLSAGIIGILSKSINLTRNFIIRFMKIETILSIIYTVELTYFLLGSYWVYKEFKPSYDPEDGLTYCDKTAYLFAMVYISIVFVVLGIALAVLLCTILGVLALDKCLEEDTKTAEAGETPLNMDVANV